MNDELLQRLRAVDPLPDGSTAPPFELVFANSPAARSHGARTWGQRALGVVVPAVVIAVSLAVVLAAVLFVRARPHVRGHRSVAVSGRHSSSTQPAPTPAVPTGGMSGHVTVWGAGFNADGAGVISLEQCLGCQANGNETAKSVFHDWLVTTADGGRTWKLSPTDYYLRGPVFDNRLGWAGGIVLLSRRQGAGPARWEPGVGVARFLKTTDSGTSWTVAPSAAPDEDGSATSLLGHDVWAFGLGVKNATILHAATAGAQLTATPSQPLINGYDTNTRVVAAGAGTAYVVNANIPRQSYVTHDDGRSWLPLTAPPCTGPNASADLDAASGQTVWIVCVGGHFRTPTLLRSRDGGHSWQPLSIRLGNDGFESFVAASPQDAWVVNGDEELLRTTNAGDSWQPVWSATDITVSPLSRPIAQPVIAPFPILSVQSADSASIITLLNRGTTRQQATLTNLVVYHTADGGRTWSTHVVPLAP